MRIRTDRKAVAAVEFALVAPVLCLVFMGMLEMGRALNVQIALTNAVREGCRGFADNGGALSSGYTPGTSAYAQYLVTDSLNNSSLHINTASLNVTSSTTSITVSGLTATQVTVTATLPYSAVSYFPAFIMNGRNLKATITMKKS